MKLAPERMLRMNLLTLNETAQPLTGLIASEGCVHLCRSNLPSVSEKGGAGEPGVSRLDELAGLMGRTGELMRWLDMVPDEGDPVPLQSILGMDTDHVVSNAEDSLEALHGKVSGYFRKQEDQETSMIRLDEISEQMNLLHDNGLSFAELDSFSHFYAVCGTVEDSQKARLENMLLEMDCAVSMRPSHGGGASFLLIGDREKQDRFDSILSQTGVRVSNPPERYLSPFEDALEQVELELWQLRDSMAELRMYYQRELPEWKSELARLHRILEVHDLLARTVSDLETDGTISLISGFVPVDRRESLVRRLDEQLGDKYYARFESVEVSPDEEIPTLLHNRGIFRPFELFVKTYGLPGYNDIDPTPFVAVSFLLMFGMMFGDVGHGMILAGIGACIAYLRYRIFDGMRDLGRILMMAGLSGTVFGFLFGSVFGIEDDSVLPALWMRPSHSGNLTTFMSVAVVIGIGIISTGIVLNIIQSIRRRNFRKAVLGQWSAASLIFFWVLLVMLGLQISGKDIGFSPVIMAAVAAAPLLMIVFSQVLPFLKRKERGGASGGEHDGENPSDEEELATVLFEPIEIVMNLFTNTVSFLRVAAFGLAHAALTMAVFTVNDMMKLPAANILSLPFEHLFIIALEGMIVTIQCLRLEYYEFFSKFFVGDGTEFKPLRIETQDRSDRAGL